MDEFLELAFENNHSITTDDLNLPDKINEIKTEPNEESTNSESIYNQNVKEVPRATRMTTRSQLKRSREEVKKEESDQEEEEEFDRDDEDTGDSISIKQSSSKRVRSSKSINEAPKKESNKEAASRYRMKKLSEKDRLFEAKQELEKQNDDVKKKIDHVQTEINYLKNIIVQMLLTKGILNNLKLVNPV